MRLIDADALDEVLDEFESMKAHAAFTEGIMVARRELTLAPTIDAEPVRHGQWKEASGGRIICNNCGHYPLYDYFGRQRLSFYCWHCGAKMDGDRND